MGSGEVNQCKLITSEAQGLVDAPKPLELASLLAFLEWTTGKEC